MFTLLARFFWSLALLVSLPLVSLRSSFFLLAFFAFLLACLARLPGLSAGLFARLLVCLLAYTYFTELTELFGDPNAHHVDVSWFNYQQVVDVSWG